MVSSHTRQIPFSQSVHRWPPMGGAWCIGGTRALALPILFSAPGCGCPYCAIVSVIHGPRGDGGRSRSFEGQKSRFVPCFMAVSLSPHDSSRSERRDAPCSGRGGDAAVAGAFAMERKGCSLGASVRRLLCKSSRGGAPIGCASRAAPTGLEEPHGLSVRVQTSDKSAIELKRRPPSKIQKSRRMFVTNPLRVYATANASIRAFAAGRHATSCQLGGPRRVLRRACRSFR